MVAKIWFLALIVVISLAVYLAIEGTNYPDATPISLKEKVTIPSIQQLADSSIDPTNESSIQVAIAGVLSPGETLDAYHSLLTYMGEKLNKGVHLILKPTYADINEQIQWGRVEAAFVCSRAYVKGNNDFGMELLVAPQIDGRIDYFSYLIVSKDSNANSLSDLRDTVFAFTDPLSNSGHLAPTYQLSLIDESAVSFFSNYVFTYNHDSSIEAVADKLVYGAAVDSLVYDQMISNDPSLAFKVKVIEKWGPYGIPPVVVNSNLDPLMKYQLRDFFLNLHNSEKGRQILAELNIDRFTTISDDAYNSIRLMMDQLGWSN